MAKTIKVAGLWAKHKKDGTPVKDQDGNTVLGGAITKEELAQIVANCPEGSKIQFTAWAKRKDAKDKAPLINLTAEYYPPAQDAPGAGVKSKADLEGEEGLPF